MEGIIQYRLLGSHPAASGRYLTLGFPGEAITVQKVLHELTTEHQINDKRYKLEVTRMVASPSESAAHSLSMDGHDYSCTGGVASSSSATAALTETTLRAGDVLHTYDRITITISARQLNDKTTSPSRRVQEAQSRRLREVERQIASPGGAWLGSKNNSNSSSSSRPSNHSYSAGNTSAAGLCGSLYDSACALPPYAPSAQPQRGEVLVDEDRDVYELQRAAVLAEQSYPVRSGARQHQQQQHEETPQQLFLHSPSGVMPGASPTSRAIHDSERCALCRLPPYKPIRQCCCGFVVCLACVESARVMWSSSTSLRVECPVCGSGQTPNSLTNEERSSSNNMDRDRCGAVSDEVYEKGKTWARHSDTYDRKAVKTESAVPHLDVKFAVSGSAATRVSESAYSSWMHNDAVAIPDASNAQDATRRALSQHATTTSVEPTHSASVAAATGRVSRAASVKEELPDHREDLADNAECTGLHASTTLRQCEHALREGLDQILAMLDAPDPLGDKGTCKHVPSTALCALDSMIY